jgi:endonuclease YncB( thermonuclease family)
MRPVLPILALLSAVSSASAKDSLAGPVVARVERVIDGATFKARADVWIDQEIEVSVRVDGIDTPELSRADCPKERERAEAARDFTAAFLSGGAARLFDIRHDKYAGRVVARVENASGADLAAALLEKGLAVEGEDGAWCPLSS